MEMMIAIFSAASSLLGSYLIYRMKRMDMEQKEEREEKRKKEELEKAKEDRKEQDRENFEYYMIQSTNAALALSEATAKAVQRIPDAKCNGDMHSALQYAADMKHQQKDFLNKKAVEKIV